MNVQGGHPRVTLPIHNASDVHPCQSHRAKRTWLGHSPGWQQPSPNGIWRQNPLLWISLVQRHPKMNIRVIYNEVYQLQRLPSRSPCHGETEEQVCQEILDSIKECLWHRWGPAQLDKESKWSPTGNTKRDTKAVFQARTHAINDHFKNMQKDSCKRALATVRDAHGGH